MLSEFENEMEVQHELQALEKVLHRQEDLPIEEDEDESLTVMEAAKEAWQVLDDEEMDVNEKIIGLIGVAGDFIPDDPGDRQRVTAISAITGAIFGITSAWIFKDPLTLQATLYASLKSVIERAAILAADEAMKRKREEKERQNHGQS